jgi:hypothetical protein
MNKRGFKMEIMQMSKTAIFPAMLYRATPTVARVSVFPVTFEGPPHSVTSYDTQTDDIMLRMTQQVWHDQDDLYPPPFSKILSAEHRPNFTSIHRQMVT